MVTPPCFPSLQAWPIEHRVHMCLQCTSAQIHVYVYACASFCVRVCACEVMCLPICRCVKGGVCVSVIGASAGSGGQKGTMAWSSSQLPGRTSFSPFHPPAFSLGVCHGAAPADHAHTHMHTHTHPSLTSRLLKKKKREVKGHMRTCAEHAQSQKEKQPEFIPKSESYLKKNSLCDTARIKKLTN